MNWPFAIRRVPRNATTRTAVPDLRLYGWSLRLARVIWLGIAVCDPAVFLVIIPSYYVQLSMLCTDPQQGCVFGHNDSVFAAMCAGARGYLLKDADQDELVRAIQAVYRGEAIFSPTIALGLMHYFFALPHTASAIAFPDLTEREREILHLMARRK